MKCVLQGGWHHNVNGCLSSNVLRLSIDENVEYPRNYLFFLKSSRTMLGDGQSHMKTAPGASALQGERFADVTTLSG